MSYVYALLLLYATTSIAIFYSYTDIYYSVIVKMFVVL